MRQCNGCTLCCRVVPIEELKKKRGVWCEHVKPGRCGIYENRPLSCRVWSCGYIKLEQIPEFMWPKNSGVILDPYPSILKLRVETTGVVIEKKAAEWWVDEKRPDAWKEPRVIHFMQVFMEENDLIGIVRIGFKSYGLLPPLFPGDGWHVKESPPPDIGPDYWEFQK